MSPVLETPRSETACHDRIVVAHIVLEQSWTSEQWAIIEDRVVFGERHAMWQTRTKQRNVDCCVSVRCLFG